VTVVTKFDVELPGLLLVDQSDARSPEGDDGVPVTDGVALLLMPLKPLVDPAVLGEGAALWVNVGVSTLLDNVESDVGELAVVEGVGPDGRVGRTLGSELTGTEMIVSRVLDCEKVLDGKVGEDVDKKLV
jgi:hypothetical protein